MRSFALLAALSASLLAVVGAQSTHDTLAKLAASNNGVITLDTRTYGLLSDPNRDWSFSVQFTALDKKRRCAPCKEFDPSWRAVAKAWTSVSKAERNQHFFATADFDNTPEVFQKMGLQTAPVVMNFGAAVGPRKVAKPDAPILNDFSAGFDAEPLARQLSQHTPKPIPYRAPIAWGFWITLAFGLMAAALTIRFVAPILVSRWTWGIITVVTMLTMTSGYMFTKIRGVPQVGPNGAAIAGGYQNQYGQEVYLLSFFYGILSFSFVGLVHFVPRNTSPAMQTTKTYFFTGLIFFMFSSLISIFKLKNPGYPFKLFF
ncbi:dolichyl-diphosphooligosaccharide-protein glycotransferase [Peniophora sp. CONT]|nr:dolichyl-diphosphooligosaccharide-protein glycotransferase [Peniophora sp. CONT]